MKIYKITYIDHEGEISDIHFPSLVEAKKWIKENRDEWEQVFEDVVTITIEKLNKENLIKLLNA